MEMEPGENNNGRFQVNIERKGKPSKWITLNALEVLKGYIIFKSD